MVSANPSGIESHVAMAVFVLLCVLSQFLFGTLRYAPFWCAKSRNGRDVQATTMSRDVYFTCCDEGIEVCVYEHEVRGNPVSMDRW